MYKKSIVTGLIGPLLIVLTNIISSFIPDSNGGLGFLLLLVIYPGVLIINLVLIGVMKFYYKDKYSIQYAMLTFSISLFVLISYYFIIINNLNTVSLNEQNL